MQEIFQQHIKIYAHSDGSLDVEIGVHCTGTSHRKRYRHKLVGESHFIWNNDRRRLAQKMDQEFFRSKKEAAVPATGNAEADQVIALLQRSPELANTLMLLARQLGNSG